MKFILIFFIDLPSFVTCTNLSQYKKKLSKSLKKQVNLIIEITVKKIFH